MTPHNICNTLQLLKHYTMNLKIPQNLKSGPLKGLDCFYVGLCVLFCAGPGWL